MAKCRGCKNPGDVMRLIPLAILTCVFVATLSAAEEAPMGKLRPDQEAFRTLYKELVETNTTLSSGSCTVAAERIAALRTLRLSQDEAV